MIRRATLDDLEWAVDLAWVSHSPRLVKLDRDALSRWLAGLLQAPHILALRGERSMAIAAFTREPWNGTVVNCELMHLFGDRSGWEPVRLGREIDRIRRAQGCARFYITSTGADLTPLARRLGAVPAGSLHVLEAAA